MNPDAEKLLADVMVENAPVDFREAMLGGALREARHRRHRRQVLRVAPVLVLVGLIGSLLHRPGNDRSASKDVARVESPYRLVLTEPLTAQQIVTSEELAVPYVSAIPDAVNLVQTTATSGPYNVINDDELLGIVHKRPAMLVRMDNHSERLVFLSAADARGFPVN
jgi:hypothetical protein